MLAARRPHSGFPLLRKPSVQFDLGNLYAAMDAAVGFFDGFSCRKMHACAFSSLPSGGCSRVRNGDWLSATASDSTTSAANSGFAALRWLKYRKAAPVT